jgi:two-component system CheB/CheR fusion protein
MRNGMALRGLRMLVIENVADIRDVFVILARLEGSHVVPVGSGRDGVEMVKNARFDVILSDLGLPDIADDTLIREIRTSPGGRHALVVVITGNSEPYVSRARQAGADAIFTKPVDWTEVLDYVRQSVPLAA